MARLEGDSGHQLQSIRGELDHALLRLRAYELLEDEVDAAVVRTAAMSGVRDPMSLIRTSGYNNNDNNNNNNNNLVATTTERLLQTVKGIPMNPERRVKQSIFLAQKLLDTERRCDDLQHQLELLQKELKDAKQQAHIAVDNLSRSSQPTSYLVGKLREEEINKTTYMNRCKSLEEDLTRCKVQVTSQKVENNQLRERLKSLLESRSELENVKNLLVQLKNNQRKEIEYDDQDDQEEEEEEVEEEEEDNDSDAEKEEEDRDAGIVLRNRNESTPMEMKSVEVLQQLFPSSPAPVRTVVSTAAALGLSPEQVVLMTSPPTHSSNSNHCSPVQ